MTRPQPSDKQAKRNVLTFLTTSGALPPNEARALECWASTFYPFQQEWLFEPARFAICNKSRQIGASHTTGAWGALQGVFLGQTTSVISIGQRESNEVLEKVELHARVLVALGSTWARHTRKGDEIRFASGGRVIALPASSGGRGFSGNVFLDEFAYHGADDEKIWDAAAAVAMHGFSVRIASTPNGVGNLFHKLWNDESANKGYARHEFLIHRAIADGMPVDLDFCWQLAHQDPRVFAQLFEGAFLDGAEQYIPTSLITDAVASEPIHFGGGFRYAGLDVAAGGDRTVLYVVERDGATGVCRVVFVDSCKRTDWDGTEKLVINSANMHGWERICVDQTGMGIVPVQRLKKKLGEKRVEGVFFGPQSKEVLATLLYQAFADRMVKLPYKATRIVKDLCSLRRIVTSTGAVRYDAPRTSEGHADDAWALALALQAVTITATGPTRSRRLPPQ